nr:DUF6103 family protein [uncultured Oscillibacter sp.]
MEKIEVTISFDAEKMDALKFYLKKEETTVQKKMDEAMRQLYEQSVPEAVREYLDAKNASPPKRPPRPSQPKAAALKPVPVPAAQEKEDGA